MKYTVIVSLTEPENVEYGDIWINPGTSACMLKINGWALLINDESIASYVEATTILTFLTGTNFPDSPSIGQIFKNTTTKQYYIYINKWSPYLGY